MTERSLGVETALEDAPGDDAVSINSVSALLGLELTTTGNTGQNPISDEDTNQSDRLAPLLGTISLFASSRQKLKNWRKSAINELGVAANVRRCSPAIGLFWGPLRNMLSEWPPNALERHPDSEREARPQADQAYG